MATIGTFTKIRTGPSPVALAPYLFSRATYGSRPIRSAQMKAVLRTESSSATQRSALRGRGRRAKAEVISD